MTDCEVYYLDHFRDTKKFIDLTKEDDAVGYEYEELSRIPSLFDMVTNQNKPHTAQQKASMVRYPSAIVKVGSVFLEMACTAERFTLMMETKMLHEDFMPFKQFVNENRDIYQHSYLNTGCMGFFNE